MLWRGPLAARTQIAMEEIFPKRGKMLSPTHLDFLVTSYERYLDRVIKHFQAGEWNRKCRT